MESFMVRCPPTSKISCSPVSPPGLYGPLIRVCWCFPKLTPILLPDLRHANTVDISKRSAIQIKLLIDLLIPIGIVGQVGHLPKASVLDKLGRRLKINFSYSVGFCFAGKLGAHHKKDSVHHIKDSVHMFQFDEPYLEHEYQVIILYYI